MTTCTLQSYWIFTTFNIFTIHWGLIVFFIELTDSLDSYLIFELGWDKVTTDVWPFCKTKQIHKILPILNQHSTWSWLSFSVEIVVILWICQVFLKVHTTVIMFSAWLRTQIWFKPVNLIEKSDISNWFYFLTLSLFGHTKCRIMAQKF